MRPSIQILLSATGVILMLVGQASAKIGPNPSGSAALAHFRALDSDRDGGLSWPELRRDHGRGLAVLLGREKSLTPREQYRLFVSRDRNHDQRLALSEINPKFAGAHAKTEALPTPVREKRTPAATQPSGTLCWVPAFGKDREDGWGLEMPVGLCGP